MSAPSNQNFPNPNAPIVGANGCMTASWRYFMNALWQRTGGANGDNGYFAYVNGDPAEAFQVADAVTGTDATPLAQVQSLDAAVLSTAETFATNAANTAQSNAETFTSTYYAPLASPALTGTPTAPTAGTGTNTTQLSTTAYALAAANTAQSNAETFATSAANTAQSNAETFATGQVRSLAGGAIASVTVGASPFAYTAPSNGLVFIEGGTVTLQQFARGATTLTAGAPNSIVPVRDGDIVTVTYTAAPTMNFAPD